MNLILCCGNAGLRERWHEALKNDFSVLQTAALQDLRQLVSDKISFDLLLVHRPLLDREIVLYIRSRRPDCRLFILSDRPDDVEGLEFLRLGAVGYANSYIHPQRLQEAVRAVAAGSVWVNQQLMQRLIAAAGTARSAIQERPASEESEALDALSNREGQIARMVAEGLSNLEIAEALGIVERTVKAHLSAVYAKTGAKGRLGLALLVRATKKA